MALALPKYVEFFSAFGGPLRYVTEGVPGVRQGYLQCSREVEILSPYTKFEIEVANTGDGGLVHIKSCYNNKYWARVSNSAAQPQWLAACADAPDEDRTKWTCTLFSPIITGPFDEEIQFMHVQLNAYVTHNLSTNPAYCLHLSRSIGRVGYSVTDWDTLAILPRHVAFKGVADESYLSIKVRQRRNYLAQEATDIGRRGVAHEASNAGNGLGRFKSISYDKFWRLSSPWVMVDAADHNKTEETLFGVVKVGQGTVALRNLRNNRFLAKQRNDVYVAADMTTPVISTFFKVEEAVLSREIHNISYRLSDATIYDEEPLVMVTADATNAGTEDATVSLRLEFVEERTRSFNNSVFAGMSLETGFKVGVPFISEGKIGISATVDYSKDWGETETLRESKSEITSFTVPPGTRVHTSVVVTKGTCHVPFSYTQEDVLLSGVPDIAIKHDGVYVGANTYNTQVVSVEEPLELVVI